MVKSREEKKKKKKRQQKKNVFKHHISHMLVYAEKSGVELSGDWFREWSTFGLSLIWRELRQTDSKGADTERKVLTWRQCWK